MSGGDADGSDDVIGQTVPVVENPPATGLRATPVARSLEPEADFFYL